MLIHGHGTGPLVLIEFQILFALIRTKYIPYISYEKEREGGNGQFRPGLLGDTKKGRANCHLRKQKLKPFSSYHLFHRGGVDHHR